MDSKQLQLDEIEVIKSIYGEDQTATKAVNDLLQVLVSVDISIGREEIPIEIDTSFYSNNPSSSSGSGLATASVSYLPPLVLSCTLPEDYPASAPPLFELSCCWLTPHEQAKIESELKKTWKEQEGQPILFLWIDTLLNLFPILNLERIFISPQNDFSSALGKREAQSSDVQAILSHLLQYNGQRKMKKFREEIHCCEICFEDKPGEHFEFMKECGHFFCEECLRSYCQVLVGEGQVLRLKCPDRNCKELLEEQLLERLLGEEDFERWKRLVDQRLLDSDPNITYCPRCSTATFKEQNNLAHCPACLFAFCFICYETWHPSNSCSDLSEKIQKLENNSGGGGGKSRAEQILQRKNMLNELKSLEHIQRNCRCCPNCHQAVEKFDGCNKMTCSTCGHYFCWLCEKDISVEKYEHFKNSKCVLFSEDQIRQWENHWRDGGQQLLHRFGDYIGNWQVGHRGGGGRGVERGPTKQCPSCKQRYERSGKNNHILCLNCRTEFCFLCGIKIKGTIHFVASDCKQHTS